MLKYNCDALFLRWGSVFMANRTLTLIIRVFVTEFYVC